MGLFKYRGESGLLVLKNLELKATPPNDFNDPFEFSPVVRTKDPKAYAKQEAKEVVVDPKFFNANRIHFPQCKNFREFQVFARANMGKMISLLETQSSKLDAELEVLDTLSQKFGVICFSGDPLQPLMWAHYGSSHKGLVLEFDQTDPVFNHASFLKVDYNAARAEYDPGSEPNRDVVELLARRKSLDWSYEQEYRLILELKNARRQKNNDQVMYLFQIEPHLLKSVTIGLRAKNSVRDEVLALASKPPLKHLKVFQVDVDKNEFKLNRNIIKSPLA